jgi:hypothetical protein
MENDIDKIFNRQFERMKAELLDINTPQGYLTIISKYWSFAKKDLQERIKENVLDKDTNKFTQTKSFR